jgi:hypothetical protein
MPRPKRGAEAPISEVAVISKIFDHLCGLTLVLKEGGVLSQQQIDAIANVMQKDFQQQSDVLAQQVDALANHQSARVSRKAYDDAIAAMIATAVGMAVAIGSLVPPKEIADAIAAAKRKRLRVISGAP